MEFIVFTPTSYNPTLTRYMQLFNIYIYSWCKPCVPTRCSGIIERPVADPKQCLPQVQRQGPSMAEPWLMWMSMAQHVTKIAESVLHIKHGEATFCYLCDMLCFIGGYDCAIAAIYCVFWRRFRKLLSVLTTGHLSSKIRDQFDWSNCGE